MPYWMSIKRGILWTDVLKKEYYKKPIFYQIHFRHLRRVLFAVVFFNPFIPINRAEVIQYNKQLYLIQHTWARFEKLRRRFARTWFFFSWFVFQWKKADAATSGEPRLLGIHLRAPNELLQGFLLCQHLNPFSRPCSSTKLRSARFIHHPVKHASAPIRQCNLSSVISHASERIFYRRLQTVKEYL